MKIMYDAGHGGKDSGAVSSSGEEEKDFTLAIAIATYELTRQLHPDWAVALTRSSDVYLSPNQRRGMAMKIRPNAFISIHCNAAESLSANGCETLFRDDEDLPLAIAVHEEMIESLDIRDRGVKNDVRDLFRQLAVLSTPGVPSILVEPGFLTNDSDREVLADKESVARSIVKGVERWVSSL